MRDRARRHWSKQLVLAAALGAMALSAAAQTAAPRWQPAQQALVAGQAEQALTLLMELEATEAGDPAFDALMGRAAHAAGRYPRAILAWERVLANRPQDADAARALARALHAVGDAPGAEAVLQRFGLRGVPVEAAQSLDQFLVSFDRRDHEGRSSWKGHLDLTVGYDSNANAGPVPDAPSLSPPGTPAWSLAPGSAEQGAGFAALQGHLRGRYVLDARWSLVGATTADLRGHACCARDYDALQWDASAGLAYRRERHEWLFSAQGSTWRQDGSTLRNTAGLLGEWIWRLDGFRQWDSFVQWQTLRYPGQSLRDAKRVVAGTSYVHVLRDGSLAYAGVYAGRESPDADGVAHLGHHLRGLRAGWQWALAPDWAAFVHATHERRRYGANDPFFALRRSDRATQVALGLSWLPAPGWRITPQLGFTRNASNLPITDYERRTVSVTVRREF